MVDGDVEETLDLVLVEVDADQAVGPGGGDEVGRQLGADRNPGLVLPVLPPVPEVGHHRRHVLGRCALRGVDQEQQLHDVVGVGHGGLDDEDIAAARVAIDPYEDLAVGEVVDRDPFGRDAQLFGDFASQWAVRAPRQEEEWAAYGGFFHEWGGGVGVTVG